MDSPRIVAQLRGAEALFQSQARIGLTSEMLEQSKASMARSLVAQIGQLRTLDVEGASVLNATLAESASFDNDQKTMIASAVSSKVLQPSVAHGNPRGTQTLLYPITYFTEADWEVFEDAQAHLSKKVLVATRRLHLLNLIHPSEATVKQLAGMLAACHFKDEPPTPQDTYGLVVEIKQAMSRNRRRPVFTQNLLVYPPSPSDLPKPFFESAYPQEADFPATRVLDNLTAMTNAIVMRSSNRRVAPIARNAALVPVQPQQDAQFQGNVSMNIVNALLQTIATHASNSRSTDSPLIHIFGDAARDHRDALPLRDALPGPDAAASGTSSPGRSASRESTPGASSHGMDAPEADHIEDPPDHESVDSGTTALEKMEAVAGGGKEMKKRPASAMQAMRPPAKRPAAAVARTAGSHRPPMPRIAMGTRVDYKTGKVLVSATGRCFRAFKQTSDKVDKAFTWKRQTHQEAWNAALDFIDRK